MKTLDSPSPDQAGEHVAEQDSRGLVRHDCNSEFEWSYFNKSDYFDCIMLNCSESGGYFESPIGPVPGSTIFMRLKESNSAGTTCGNDAQLRSATLARVEWCRLVIKKQNAAYGVGIKFFVYY